MNMQRTVTRMIKPGGSKVNTRSENYTLSPKTIDIVSEICVQALTEARADKKDIIRVRLSLEEVLGVWLEPLAGAMVHVDCGQKFGRAFLKISVDGPTINPWEDEALVLSSHMLSQAGLSFTYAYKDGKNCLVCNPRKKKSSMGQALQTIKFKLDNKGGSLKSEAAIGLMKTALPIADEKQRHYNFDKRFVLFLKEKDKEKPYYAMVIDDIKYLVKE